MLENGIYDLRYRAAGSCEAGVSETGASEAAAGGGLAMLRDGEILGSDPWGGLFVGSCAFDPEARLNRLHLRFQVPPEGMLITGFCAGPAGAVLDIVGAVARPEPEATTIVEVAGAPVSVALTYLGPLASDGRRPPIGCP